MINYIIQVLLFQIVFLAVYDFVLKKETFFQWNRAYLILTSVLAYLLPLIKLQTISQNLPQEYVVMLPEVMLSPSTYIENQIDWSVILFASLQWVFLIGITLATLLFAYKLTKIFNLINKNNPTKNKDFSLILLEENNTAFSFFNYIFLGKSTKKKEEIIKHELIHVKQKHSIDLLFFEVQKIMFWFNPFSYIYQNRIAEIHEFIADSKTVKKKEKSTFYHSLLAETFAVDKIAFVNAFNKQSLIKKRIIMFSKKKSKEILKFKYLLMIPVLMGMMIYTSCENTAPEEALSKVNEKRLTKIIMTGYTTKDGKVVSEKILGGEREGYFDLYFNKIPDGDIISSEKLSAEEKSEYLRFTNSFKNSKIYQLENGNKVLYLDMESFFQNKEKVDYSDASEVPFAAIDQAPVFPGCDDAEDQKACMVEKITEFVSSNFDVDISKNLGLEPGKKRVFVQFKIDKTGNIVDVRARGPHADLEEEAVRVINSLPKMQSGKQNGKKVSVKYTLPITLVVE